MNKFLFSIKELFLGNYILKYTKTGFSKCQSRELRKLNRLGMKRDIKIALAVRQNMRIDLETLEPAGNIARAISNNPRRIKMYSTNKFLFRQYATLIDAVNQLMNTVSESKLYIQPNKTDDSIYWREDEGTRSLKLFATYK